MFKELDRVLKPDGTYYVFCDAQSYPIFYETMFPYNKYIRLLIWDKIISYNGYTWRHQHELIAWGEKEEAIRIPTSEGDIIKHRGVLQENRLHPAEKPIGILKKLIKKHDCTDILDPFAGSGSTMYACQDLRKNCVSIELDSNYCEVIRKRCFSRKFLDRTPQHKFIRFSEDHEDE